MRYHLLGFSWQPLAVFFCLRGLTANKNTFMVGNHLNIIGVFKHLFFKFHLDSNFTFIRF